MSWTNRDVFMLYCMRDLALWSSTRECVDRTAWHFSLAPRICLFPWASGDSKLRSYMIAAVAVQDILTMG